MKLNPDSKIIAGWRSWKRAPREPMARWSGTSSILFMLVPSATLIGGVRSLLGLNGSSLLDRAAAVPFLVVGLGVAYLERVYLKRPVRPSPY